MSLEQYFATGPSFERHVYDAVVAHLEGLGPLRVEFVSVGIFFKRARTFAELRPKRDRVLLSVLLSRRFSHPRIVRTYRGHGMRTAYFIALHAVEDVDDEVRDWLTEAYFASPL